MLSTVVFQGIAPDLTVNLDESGLTIDQEFGKVSFQIGDLPTVFEIAERFQLNPAESLEEKVMLSGREFIFSQRGVSAFAIEDETCEMVVIVCDATGEWIPEIRNQL